MRELARRVAAAVVWLALVVAIALGAAGLVSGADHPPGSTARPELTWARDGDADAALDAVTGQLSVLADQVAALGVQARGALAALNGTEPGEGREELTHEAADGLRAMGSGARRSIRASRAAES
jgi:hypothetical protein